MRGYTPSDREFRKRVKHHRLTILHVDGLYRHLRFACPYQGSVDQFDLVTWPGSLCYCGDMGDYVFTRCDDMFSFFRRSRPDGRTLDINPYYWSEKVVAADRDQVKHYTTTRAKQVIRYWVQDEPHAIQQAVRYEILSRLDDGGEEFIRRLCDDFERGGRLIFQDFHEADLTEFTYRFIFCCRAIAWGIAQYDKTTVDPVDGC